MGGFPQNSHCTEKRKDEGTEQKEIEAKGPLGVRGQIYNDRESISKPGSLKLKTNEKSLSDLRPPPSNELYCQFHGEVHRQWGPPHPTCVAFPTARDHLSSQQRRKPFIKELCLCKILHMDGLTPVQAACFKVVRGATSDHRCPLLPFPQLSPAATHMEFEACVATGLEKPGSQKCSCLPG